MLKGVILDIDGTLVDSNDAHAHSWVETLREAGYDVPFDVIRPMIGMGGDKLLPAAIGIEMESDIGKRLGEQRWEIFQKKYLPNLRAFPGSRVLAVVRRIATREEALEAIGGHFNTKAERCEKRSFAAWSNRLSC